MAVSPVSTRYDFVLLFDVQDGNPNGDPDAGNLLRIDPQSLQGIVTDGCLKRKVRNAISVIGGTEELFELIEVPPLGADKAPRSFKEYKVAVKEPPKGVKLHRLVG